MVTAKAVVNLTTQITISFSDESIESYDAGVYTVEEISLVGAEDLGLSEEDKQILLNRARDIALSQFDLLEAA